MPRFPNQNMHKKIPLLALVIIAFFAGTAAFGQPEEKFDFYLRGPYRQQVPRPQAILRYDVGEHHTTYAQMEKVIDEIAKAAPDRVRLFDIGLTPEFRMMRIVAISSPENIARLEEIKSNIARLTDPRKTSAGEAQAIARDTPAIAWMAYTIHGNESSSFEAMMQVVYQLAASEEPATLDILKNTVVLVVTGENPDGHERFATWYNSVAIGDADRNAIEHREPWSIYGRLNHYRFNLNRDTLAVTQRETQHMMRAFMEWNPQVAVDHHGQPSQYFFPPVSLPINPNLPQPMYNRWLDIYGRANAAAFDANKWDYYVRDVFDAFYPGYWDMYPSLNGAIGMTYETDGGGFKGLRWTRDDGTIVTFRSSIAKHFVASMTTLGQTAANREARLRDFYEFRSRAMAEASKSAMKRVVIIPDRDKYKSAELIEILNRMKIEVKIANASFKSNSAHDYLEKNSTAKSATFPAGSYIIDLNQPQRLLIKAILEQDTPQDKAFVDDNIARFKRNQMRGKNQQREEYGFYDITAWSLPLAFGVEAYWTEDAPDVSGTPVSAETLASAKRGSVPSKARIAYVIPYSTDTTGAFVARLLQKGFRVAVATRPLNAGGKNWPAGTFVVRISRNPETIHDAVAQTASELGVDVVAVDTGFADEGDTGVGGEAVLSLRAPKIAVIADEGIDPESYGSIWWTFERFGVKFTPISIAAVRAGALRNFNVLIIPDGNPSRYFAAFGSSGVSALKDWAAAGGTVITARGASVFAALKEVGLTSSRLVGSEDDDQKPASGAKTEAESGSKPAPATSPSPKPMETPEMKTDRSDITFPVLPPIASPSASANRVPEPLPGAFMRATVDRTSYLNYGVNVNELPVLLASGYFFRISKEGGNPLVFEANPRKPLTVSGFVWEGNTEPLLAGTAYLIDEPTGGGHVILFAEDPFFRGLTRATTRQFFNAIIFNGVL